MRTNKMMYELMCIYRRSLRYKIYSGEKIEAQRRLLMFLIHLRISCRMETVSSQLNIFLVYFSFYFDSLEFNEKLKVLNHEQIR